MTNEDMKQVLDHIYRIGYMHGLEENDSYDVHRNSTVEEIQSFEPSEEQKKILTLFLH